MQRFFRGAVYNLSVDGPESFIANGFAVHNCRCTLQIIPPGTRITADGRLERTPDEDE